MSALPAQVQAQGEAADRMLADLAKPPETPQPAEPPAPTTEVQPSPASAPAPAAPAATEQPKPADEATWEHRYKTLQGMFSAQKQRDEEARKSLENQLRDALARIAELEQAAKKPAEQPQPLVTEKDTEAFGADLIDLARRIAQDTVQQQMGEVRKLVAAKDREIAELRKQLGGVAEQTKVVGQHAYFTELTKAVPDWEAINTSQSWLEWLAQPDPLSGRPRQDYLDDAFAKQDVLRTAQIFNAFKATRPAAQPAPQQPPAELQRQVQPATSQATPIALTANADAKIWTAAEVGQFYDDVAKGKYRGKEAEMNRISAEIDAAIATGRVR